MLAVRRRRIAFVVAGTFAGLVLAYAAFGFFLAPRLIERKLAEVAQTRLGQQLAVDRLRVNPFALSAEAMNLRLGAKSAQPVVAARRLYLDFALLRSIASRSWVLAEAQCDGLRAQVELQKNGRLNLADFADRWSRTSPPSKPAAGPLRMTIGHLLVGDGVLTYTELTGTAASTQLLPIRIELQNVSTLPDREGRYSVAARFVDGGTLSWRGDLSLQPAQSEGDLELQSLKLATAWKFVQDKVRIQEPDGWLTVALHYRFGYAGGKPELAASRIRVHAAGVGVKAEGARDPLVAMKSVEVRDGRFQLGKRLLELPVVALSDGRLNLARDTDGAWNWAGLVQADAPASRKAKPGEAAAQQPWRVEIAAASLQNVAARLNDWQHPAPLSVQALVSGRTAVAMEAGDAFDLRLRDADLRVDKLRLPDRDAPVVELAALRLQGGYLDLARQELGAKLLSAEGGTVRIERTANGTVPALQMFGSGERAAPTPASAPAKPWRYALDTARLRSVDIALVDRGQDKPATWELKGVSADASRLASGGDKPLAFDAAATVGTGGSLKASGSVAPDFSQADAVVRVSALGLAPLQPLVARYAAVTLVSGRASATAAIAYRRGGQPSLTARGPFDVRDVRFDEAGTGQRLVAWKRLYSADALFALDPARVRIKEIIIDKPDMKIDISEQRQLNLLQVVRHEGAAENPPPASPAQQDAQPVSVHIGEVRLRDGAMDYADRSLVLPFATRVTRFEGAAASLSTDHDRHANLRFEGEIGDSGSAKIEGSLDAFSPQTFTDVNAAFQNVDMPALSPYTATFLGRKIASGKLWLDLDYKIDDGELTGDNKVTIHRLALGEPVEAPGVKRLPLDLAVALLADSEGVIRTAVPVKGNVNDPKFAIGTVVREALGNMIAKIVSAPFRALAGLFGEKRSDQDAGRVEFEPGSAKLMPSEKEKLESVAKALDERPQLKLVVQAPYSPEADRGAIQRDQAAREVALALGRLVEPDEKPAPLAFENVATQRALERTFSAKAAPAAMRDLVAQYAQQSGHEPKRVGTVLRSAGEPEFYKMLFEALVRAEPVPDEAMQRLAETRAHAVVALLQADGVDADRVQPGPVQEHKGEEKKNVAAELLLQTNGVSDADTGASKQASR